CLAEVVVERPGHVEEDAVALRAEQQRDVLVRTVAADAKRIDGPGRERLAASVEGAKMLAQPEERLLGPEPGRQPAQAASVPGRVSIGTAPPRSSSAANSTPSRRARALRTPAIARGSRGAKSLAGRAGRAVTSRAGSTRPGEAVRGRSCWACRDRGAPGSRQG